VTHSIAPLRPQTRVKLMEQFKGLRFGQQIGLAELAGQYGPSSRELIRRVAKDAVSSGVLEYCGSNERPAWQRLPTPEKTYPKASIRSKAWTAIRIFGVRHERFEVDDLVQRISSEPSREMLVRYVAALTKSGHLQRRERGVFRLLRNTGPLAPVITRGVIYDPNTGEHHG